jgi:PAS domain S-box-containing protein
MTYTHYIIPMLLAAVVSAGLFIYLLRRRAMPGAFSLALLLLAGTWWLVGETLLLTSDSLSVKLFWTKLEYIGIVSVPLAWLAFAVDFAGRRQWLTRMRLAFLAIIPAVTLLLAWTNDIHGLIWADLHLYRSGSLLLVESMYGPWFWVNIGYSYLLVVAGAFLVLRAALYSFQLYRRQAVVVLVGVLVPTVGNVVYVFKMGPYGMDLTPLMFTFSGFVLALGISRFKLADIVPVARDIVIDGMSEGLLMLDVQDRVVDMNRAAIQIAGLVPTNAIGQPVSRLLSSWTELEKGRSNGLAVGQTETAVGDGVGRRYYDVRFSSLLDRRGMRIGGLVILTDITERKLMEQRLQESYEREKGLRQELEEEIKKRLEFTRALVHELRTPVTSMMVSSEMLASGVKEEPWLALSKSIHRGVIHLNNRIGELLDVARGEVGMLRIDPELVDVNLLLSEVFEDLTPVASSQRKALVSELPGSLPTIWADPERLRQVVLNLLDNALKYTPEGGIITLGAVHADSSVTVRVSDTGRGISDDEQKLLFRPYRRFGGSGESKPGLGLGLALCKTLVELHGGQISVESVKGRGSTFSFSLPLREPQQVFGGTQTHP